MRAHSQTNTDMPPAVTDGVAAPDTAVSTATPPSLGTVLLVSAAFPPWTAVGAARWEGFAPYLNAAGRSLCVLFEEPQPGAPVDSARVARLGSGVTTHAVVRRSPAWRSPVLRAAALIGGNTPSVGASEQVLVTDVQAAGDAVGGRQTVHPRVYFGAAVEASRSRNWIRDVVAASETLPEVAQATVVVSSGPPHDAHVAASNIAARRGLPHVLDLRDPWVDNPGTSRIGDAIFGSPTNARAERRVMLAAAALITNTPSAAAALVARYPELAGRVHTVLNGSDRAPEPPRVLPADAPYVIVHTGNLYLDRDPRPFLRAVSAVRARLGERAARLRVVFMGHPASIEGRLLGEWARDFGLDGCFEERPFGTRAEATALMDAASMLVAFQGATPTQVPAKIFDYVSNAAAILALTDPRTATAAVLEGTTALVAPIDDIDAIATHIEHAFTQAAAGVPIVAVDADGRFARATQAAVLERILTSISPR